MKKNKLSKRIAVFFLTFALVCSNSVYLYADEESFIDSMDEDYNDGGSNDAQDQQQDQQQDEQQDQQDGQQDQQDQQEEKKDEQQDEKKDEDKKDEEKKDEQQNQQEDKKDGQQQQEDKKEEEKKEDPAAAVGKLTVESGTLSFGTIKTTDTPRPVSFTVRNEGSGQVSLGWSQTDSTGVFLLNMPSNVNIPLNAGEAIQGSVEIAKDKLSTGDYATTLVFSDLNNPSVQVKINVSLRVENASPTISKIRIWPSSTSLKQGDSMRFDVTVEGDNNPDTGVTWKLNGNTSSGTTLGSDGTLKIAKDESAGNLTVIVTSKQNSNYKDTATVSIAKDKFVVNATIEPSDAGYVTGKGSFSGGERTTLTAVAESGYKFSEWRSENNEFITNSPSFTTGRITGDIRYKAIFTQSEYEIKVKSSDKEKGTVKGGGYVDRGGSTTIEAVPKDGYVFDGWYEKDKLVSRDKKLKVKDVKKSHTFVAEFKKDKLVVKVAPSPADGGSASGAGTYSKGDTVTLKATASSGYHFAGYILNNQLVSSSADYKIKDLDRDLSITAFFEKDNAKSYTIKSGVANSGGVISPSGDVKVTEGNSMTYVMSPDNGYGILAVSVDGKQIGAVTSYTFNNVKGDHTISVAFAPKEDSVNKVKMDKIISTEEAAAIASAKLSQAASADDSRSSTVITPEEYAAMKERQAAETAQSEKNETEGDTEVIVIPQEQNLIGMDDTEDLKDVVEGYNPDKEVGVYQSLNITRETAEKLIDGGGDTILINEAYELGYLDVLINNEYMVPGKEGELLDLENDNTVSNLQEVVRACLTKEEKLKLFEGKEIMLSFTVSGTDNPGDYEKEMMKDAKNVDVDRYLYMTLMKSVEGVPQLVEELDTPMEIKLSIPAELRDSKKNFCIVRNHNGEVDVLEDLDDDPDTITIKTDRFSPYALGHQSSGSNMRVFIIIAVAIALTLLILATYINMRGKKRRRRRTA